MNAITQTFADLGKTLAKAGAPVAEKRVHVRDALDAFLAQDALKARRIGSAADAVMLAANVGQNYPVRVADILLLKQFVDFLAAEADVAGLLAPDLGKPDPIIRDMNGDRLALTGEPV